MESVFGYLSELVNIVSDYIYMLTHSRLKLGVPNVDLG